MTKHDAQQLLIIHTGWSPNSTVTKLNDRIYKIDGHVHFISGVPQYILTQIFGV